MDVWPPELGAESVGKCRAAADPLAPLAPHTPRTPRTPLVDDTAVATSAVVAITAGRLVSSTVDGSCPVAAIDLGPFLTNLVIVVVGVIVVIVVVAADTPTISLAVSRRVSLAFAGPDAIGFE